MTPEPVVEEPIRPPLGAVRPPATGHVTSPMLERVDALERSLAVAEDEIRTLQLQVRDLQFERDHPLIPRAPHP